MPYTARDEITRAVQRTIEKFEEDDGLAVEYVNALLPPLTFHSSLLISSYQQTMPFRASVIVRSQRKTLPPT